MLLSLIVLAGALASAPESPRPGSEPATPARIAETFLQQVAKGEVDAAFENLPKGTILTSQPQKFELLVRQTKAAQGIYGAFLGLEQVRLKEYTPSVVRLTYVMKFEQFFLVWNLAFYRPKDRWETAAVAFLDQLSALE
jgi:hypothetical protein